MIRKKEYLTVNEISKHQKMSKRNVRNIIANMIKEKDESLIHKDYDGTWRIHHLLLNEFQRQRTSNDKYYALTITPPTNYTTNDIHDIMKFVTTTTNTRKVEINYTIESRKVNDINQVHCYIMCPNRKNLLNTLKLAFSNLNYHQAEIFDLEGWKNYITKEGNSITTIKK